MEYIPQGNAVIKRIGMELCEKAVASCHSSRIIMRRFLVMKEVKKTAAKKEEVKAEVKAAVKAAEEKKAEAVKKTAATAKKAETAAKKVEE